MQQFADPDLKRTVRLFVERIFIMRHRAVRYAATTFRQVCEATIKVGAMLLVFTVCLMVTLKYLGVPVPSADQILHDVAGLTRIFS